MFSQFAGKWTYESSSNLEQMPESKESIEKMKVGIFEICTNGNEWCYKYTFNGESNEQNFVLGQPFPQLCPLSGESVQLIVECNGDEITETFKGGKNVVIKKRREGDKLYNDIHCDGKKATIVFSKA